MPNSRAKTFDIWNINENVDKAGVWLINYVRISVIRCFKEFHQWFQKSSSL